MTVANSVGTVMNTDLKCNDGFTQVFGPAAAKVSQLVVRAILQHCILYRLKCNQLINPQVECMCIHTTQYLVFGHGMSTATCNSP